MESFIIGSKTGYAVAVIRPEAVLFDFDYTLADSSDGIVECTNYALRAMGHPRSSAQDVRSTIGLSLEEMFFRFTGVEDPGPAAEFSRLYIEHADRVMLGHTRMYQGVEDMARQLQKRGIRLAIVTTKYSRRVRQALERDGIAEYFDPIVGSEMVARPKPCADSVLLALSMLGVDGDRSLFVGDSVADAAAAQAAGVGFVAVLTGQTPGQSLAAFPMLVALPDAVALVEWLDGSQGDMTGS